MGTLAVALFGYSLFKLACLLKKDRVGTLAVALFGYSRLKQCMSHSYTTDTTDTSDTTDTTDTNCELVMC